MRRIISSTKKLEFFDDLRRRAFREGCGQERRIGLIEGPVGVVPQGFETAYVRLRADRKKHPLIAEVPGLGDVIRAGGAPDVEIIGDEYGVPLPRIRDLNWRIDVNTQFAATLIHGQSINKRLPMPDIDRRHEIGAALRIVLNTILPPP
ncbi:hypothetical protein WOA01_18070 [Methylocystis sp. IM2]|uniref:hypothetical protein n=1 Tax=unclassified Methylocystis TaxID=2625913 RepID=UPI0030FB590E